MHLFGMHRFQLGMSLIFEQALDEQDEGVEMDDLLVRKGVPCAGLLHAYPYGPYTIRYF